MDGDIKGGLDMNTEQTIRFWPGMELTIDQQNQVVESNRPVPDPSWRYVDQHGHGHFYDEKAREFPTLEWVVLPCTMGHGDECTSEGYYKCPLCDEEISPGTVMPRPQIIQGPVTYTLAVEDARGTTTYRFGPEQWSAVQSAVEREVTDVLAEYAVERTWGG